MAKTEKKLKLIFITCAVDEAFFSTVKQGMRDAATMLGVEAEFTGIEGVDLEAQAAMVMKAVADGYDGIALNIIHATAFNEVVQAALDRGVPVVAFNVDGTYGRGPHLSSVNQDLYQAGRALGEKAAPHLPDGARVLITMHDEGISALEDRARGIREVIEEVKNATSETTITGTEPEKAAEIIAAKLKADSAIKAVLCTGQADTEGAGLAIEKYGKEADYYTAGFDLSPEILRLVKVGVIRFVIDQQPYVQGFYPVVQLVLYCRYGIMPSNMDAGVGIITQESVDSVMEFSAKGYR